MFFCRNKCQLFVLKIALLVSGGFVLFVGFVCFFFFLEFVCLFVGVFWVGVFFGFFHFMFFFQTGKSYQIVSVIHPVLWLISLSA